MKSKDVIVKMRKVQNFASLYSLKSRDIMATLMRKHPFTMLALFRVI